MAFMLMLLTTMISIITSNYLFDPNNVRKKHSDKAHDQNWPNLKNYDKNGTKEATHIKRILAFGDSITEGYLSADGPLKFFPYSTKLETLLNKHATATRYEVINEGVSGECVFTEMATRLPKVLKNYENVELVIILGGTNDLRKLDCDKKINIAYEIINLHEVVHNKGVKSVVVTIPEADETNMTLTHYSYEKYKQIWKTTNDKLKHYAHVHSNMTLLCDLAKQFPMKKLTDENRRKHWSDHLHPSRFGYKKLAEILFNVLKGEFKIQTE